MKYKLLPGALTLGNPWEDLTNLRDDESKADREHEGREDDKNEAEFEYTNLSTSDLLMRVYLRDGNFDCTRFQRLNEVSIKIV